ncbi:MAG: metallophosphoesterase [Draconibacterium sp.]|nr:metallophosphoesterase [Draconibacterium sp.]
MKRFLIIIVTIAFFSCDNSDTVRFAVCTDVHQDLIHDAPDRIGRFVEGAERENVDFIIQLGDFCLPFEKNEPFLKIWNSFDGPKYHVLGNHDMDVSPKIFIQDFVGMENSYYSFDKGDFHFVVLDANFLKKDEQYISYSGGNYFSDFSSRAHIPPYQVEWLKNDLEQTEKTTIIFSHQSLEHWGGIKNRKVIWEVFKDANKDKKKVVACFCGHDHEDRYKEIEGIHFIGINSISNAWVGEEFKYSGRFPESIEEKFPNLKYTLPYRDPVYAFIEISKKGTIKIEGIQSYFVKPGPEELGMDNHSYSAKISNRVLTF